VESRVTSLRASIVWYCPDFMAPVGRLGMDWTSALVLTDMRPNRYLLILEQ